MLHISLPKPLSFPFLCHFYLERASWILQSPQIVPGFERDVIPFHPLFVAPPLRNSIPSSALTQAFNTDYQDRSYLYAMRVSGLNLCFNACKKWGGRKA